MRSWIRPWTGSLAVFSVLWLQWVRDVPSRHTGLVLTKFSGVVPIIRCPGKGAAEAIAAKLDRKLRDHVLASKDNLFSGQKQRQSSAPNQPVSRPVLVILDRQIDLVPMLTHSWTYSSLVNDALKMHLNRITVEVPPDENSAGKTAAKRSYDINSKDFFWAASIPQCS